MSETVLRMAKRAATFAVAFAAHVAAAAESPGLRVLVIDQEGPTRPAFVQFIEGLREGLVGAGTGRHEVFIENLDLVRLGRRADDPERAAGWLIEKYRDLSFDVIVSTSRVVRDFILANRERLSPGARIVSLERPGETLDEADRPAGFTFVTADSPVTETVLLACRILPATKRVAFIGQSLPHPKFLERQAADAERTARERGLDYVPLVDLDLADLRARLAALPPDSAVIFHGYWKDENSRTYVPAEVLEILTRESPLPFFGLVDTQLGRGIVGGACADLRAMGDSAGRLCVAVRADDSPAPVKSPSVVLFDQRQLDRFGIPTARLPAGSRVLFREPRLWERYWPQIVGGVALVALETALLLALLRQLRLRRRAERVVDEQRDQIAHAGRVSTLGQFAASLAHELGQPLGAILNNIDAAEMLLRKDDSPLARELREIVDDIAADERRAGEVLDRIRAMVRRQRLRLGPVDVQGVIRGALELAGPRMRSDGIGITVVCDPGLPRVVGDEILLQQALINLVVNSADAIRTREVNPSAGSPPRHAAGQDAGRITIEARRDGDAVELAVIDDGGGIRGFSAGESLEPFVTTKQDGLGMGLPIVRSIVEQHAGTLRLDNDPGRGVSVRIRLPAWAEERVA